ncbi:MAG: DUF2851 family protein [Flavobacteriales bacterium]|nr:DUF2851 family protein [Flavobacteriales bacterium]
MSITLPESIDEAFIAFVWENQLLPSPNLLLHGGKACSVVQPGRRNDHAGPDFTEARIRVGNITWAGHVEIHVRSSDWVRHQHQCDPAYNNVILHVVWVHDTEVRSANGRIPEVFEIRKWISDDVLSRMNRLHFAKSGLPCGNAIHQVSAVEAISWLDRMMVERLEHRISVWKTLIKLCGDWDEAIYRMLCRSFGFHVNALPFQWLAQRLPLKVIQKKRHDLMMIEAALFGTAGLLPPQSSHPYVSGLIEKYQYWLTIQKTPMMDGHVWKFLRMRPYNFPTFRMAQLAALLYAIPSFSGLVRDTEKVHDLLEKLELNASPFWKEHWHFKQNTKPHATCIGVNARIGIVVNTMAPALFAMGEAYEQQAWKERALNWLQVLKPEDNHITRMFCQSPLEPVHSGHSQALFHLHDKYCQQKKCLICNVGSAYLRAKEHPPDTAC